MSFFIGKPPHQHVAWSYTDIDRQQKIVFIQDDLGPVSVTNRAERVCEDAISGLSPDMWDYRLFYKDTVDCWSEMKHDHGRFIEFAPNHANVAPRKPLVDAEILELTENLESMGYTVGDKIQVSHAFDPDPKSTCSDGKWHPYYQINHTKFVPVVGRVVTVSYYLAKDINIRILGE